MIQVLENHAALGRDYEVIIGGMWEITLRSLDGKKLVDNLAS